VPLRWRGGLREDPMRLPWGRRFEIDREQVEIAGARLPVTGGLCEPLSRAAHSGRTRWNARRRPRRRRCKGARPRILLVFESIVALAVLARMAPAKRRGRFARRQLVGAITTGEWSAPLDSSPVLWWSPHIHSSQICSAGYSKLPSSTSGRATRSPVAFPTGHTTLMDGGGIAGSEVIAGIRSGPEIGEEVVSPYLWTPGPKRIDVMALAHPPHNHLDGLHTVLQNFGVSELRVGRGEETPSLLSLLEEARARAVTIVTESG
jgi:hypothetical protein